MSDLGLIVLESSKKLGKKVDKCLTSWSGTNDTFIIKSSCPRFGTGEAKAVLHETIRGRDLYLLVDVCNHSLTYNTFGHKNHMSPDDHYQDLKRIISAIGGHAKRVNVIMPFLYGGRQHRRNSRESLDCALMLQELTHMGVDRIVTVDAHDPRIQNAIPLKSFENINPILQFIKVLLENVKDLKLNKDELIVISPDEGAMERAIYLATILGVNTGMFYKRRDYSKIINGKNPIIAHEYLGEGLDGKDVIIIDDMISSGGSMIDVASELKNRKAKRVYMMTTFGLFTDGLDVFDKAYENNIFNGLLTTNLVYQTPELLNREYYMNVDMSEYMAAIIDVLNKDKSISNLISPSGRIKTIVDNYNKR